MTIVFVLVRVNAESEIPHENQSICLITTAQVSELFCKILFTVCFPSQAAHWFDLKQFYSEVQRTLKPQGVLAIYGYGLPSVKDSVKVNNVIQNVILIANF